MAGEAEQLGPLSSTDGGKPRGASAHDKRHSREGFHVVDDRRSAPQPCLDRKRRFGARHGALAFDRFHECRLFSEDKAARSPPKLKLKGEITSEDPFAE